MSDGIAGRIDEMGVRIDDLDKSITQVQGLREKHPRLLVLALAVLI